MDLNGKKLDRSLLQQEPPRHIPPWLLVTVPASHLKRRSLRAYLDPPFLAGVIALVSLKLLQARHIVLALPLAILGVRLGLDAWRVQRKTRKLFRLLRQGKIVNARILGIRPAYNPQGKEDGVYLDCFVPVDSRRASVGSIWFASMSQAERLQKKGQVTAICLSQAPGTWYLLDDLPPANN